MVMAGFALVSAESGHSKFVARIYVASVRVRLRSRFACARAEGDVPAGVDAGGLADVLLCVLQGMAVQAGTGASERDLQRMIDVARSEEHTSELQSLMRTSYAVFCLKKKKSNYAKSTKNASDTRGPQPTTTCANK